MVNGVPMQARELNASSVELRKQISQIEKALQTFESSSSPKSLTQRRAAKLAGPGPAPLSSGTGKSSDRGGQLRMDESEE